MSPIEHFTLPRVSQGPALSTSYPFLFFVVCARVLGALLWPWQLRFSIFTFLGLWTLTWARWALSLEPICFGSVRFGSVQFGSAWFAVTSLIGKCFVAEKGAGKKRGRRMRKQKCEKCVNLRPLLFLAFGPGGWCVAADPLWQRSQVRVHSIWIKSFVLINKIDFFADFLAARSSELRAASCEFNAIDFDLGSMEQAQL